jgi:DNA processing protein
MDDQATRREQAAVLALTEVYKGPWHRVSRELAEVGSAVALLNSECAGSGGALELWPGEAHPEAEDADRRIARMDRLISAVEVDPRTWLTTVLDQHYPRNLRLVYDRPPFLFVRGRMMTTDHRAIAVVGTRAASSEGVRQSQALASGLAEQGIAVVSGLAAGIDSAAHEATLRAGGRTIAVMGTGINLVYPRQNRGLAEAIVNAGGAVVSQFFPDAPPTRWRFPLRNRTMSGMALGTVVVEASSTSGARMQARIALEHGRRVFLVDGLVTREPWAQQMIDHPAVTVVDDAGDVLDVVGSLITGQVELSAA